MNEGSDERAFTVYRVDYVHRTRVPIGRILERRRAPRRNDAIGLLQLARRQYSAGTDEALSIAIFVACATPSAPSRQM